MSKKTKLEGTMPGIRWMILLFVGIVVGGTALALERIFDLGRTPVLDGIVLVSVLVVAVAFLGFMSRLRD